jgi:hypothetical protein
LVDACPPAQAALYTVTIQPGAETDERLRNAGWSPEVALWHVALGYVETDSSAYLGHSFLTRITQAECRRETCQPAAVHPPLASFSGAAALRTGTMALIAQLAEVLRADD